MTIRLAEAAMVTAHVGFDHAPVDHDSLRAYNRVVRPMGADSPLRPATADENARIRLILRRNANEVLIAIHGSHRYLALRRVRIVRRDRGLVAVAGQYVIVSHGRPIPRGFGPRTDHTGASRLLRIRGANAANLTRFGCAARRRSTSPLRVPALTPAGVS